MVNELPLFVLRLALVSEALQFALQTDFTSGEHARAVPSLTEHTFLFDSFFCCLQIFLCDSPNGRRPIAQTQSWIPLIASFLPPEIRVKVFRFLRFRKEHHFPSSSLDATLEKLERNQSCVYLSFGSLFVSILFFFPSIIWQLLLKNSAVTSTQVLLSKKLVTVFRTNLFASAFAYLSCGRLFILASSSRT